MSEHLRYLEWQDAVGIATTLAIVAVLWFRARASENPDYEQWAHLVWNHYWHPIVEPADPPLHRWWFHVRATVALGLMRAGPDMYAHEAGEWGRCAATLFAGQYMTDWGIGYGFQELRVSGWRYIIYQDGTL